MTTFGLWLKTQREGRKLSGNALAQRASISQTTVSKIESGVRDASREMALALADALQLEDSSEEARERFRQEALAALVGLDTEPPLALPPSLETAAQHIADVEARLEAKSREVELLKSQLAVKDEQLAAKDAEIEVIKNAPLLDSQGNPFPRVILGFLTEFLEELATAPALVLSACRVVMQNGLTRDQIRQWIAKDKAERESQEAEAARGYPPLAQIKTEPHDSVISSDVAHRRRSGIKKERKTAVDAETDPLLI